MFPKEDLFPVDKQLPPNVTTDGNVISDFFEGIEVLMLHYSKHKEDIFASYFNGKYVGFTYLGERYTSEEIYKLCDKYFPKKWDDIQDYVNRLGSGEIFYHKLENHHYTFIANRVIIKTNKNGN